MPSHIHKLKTGSTQQRIKLLAKDSVLYGGAATLSKMLSLLMLPILTRIFTNAEYGALDIMTVAGGIFVAAIIMGQDTAIARFFYEHDDEDVRKQVISQGILIELFFCILLTSFGWFGAEYILGSIYGIPEYVDIFRLLVLSFPFVVTLRFTTNLLRWRFARFQFVVVGFGSSGVIVGLTILFVAGFDMGMRGVFIAQIVGSAIFAPLGLYFCRHYFALPQNFRFGRRLFAYGFPYMVIALATWLIPAIDRALIGRSLGLDVLGSYAIGYRWAFMISLPIHALFSSYQPFALLLYKEPSAAETYNRVLTLAVSGMALLAVFMVSVAEPVIEIVASARYLAGHVAVLPIAMGLVVQMMSQIMGIGIDLAKKTHYHVVIRSVGIGSTALFMWLLIEPLGILGVGIGFLLGKIAQAAVFAGLAYYAYPLRFAWKRPVSVLILASASAALMQSIELDTMLLQIGYRTAILCLLTALIWFATFSREDRGRVISILRGYFPDSQETTND